MTKSYTRDHEWCMPTAAPRVWRIGITDLAQDQLGDVVNIELPSVGSEVTAGESCGCVESVKAASDIKAPLSGKVTTVNNDVAGDPALINRSAEEEGWLFEVEVTGEAVLVQTLNAEEYAKEFPQT